MSDNPFLSPLQGSLHTLQRVGVIYWRSSSVRLFLKLAILFVVPATCLLLALVYTALHKVHSRQQQQPDNGGFMDQFGYYAAVLGSESLIRSTLGAVADGAIAVAVADIYLQRHPRWFTCLQRASSKVVTLLLAGTVAGIAIVLGSFCFLVPGLFLKLNFLLVTPVIVLEDEISVLSALGRSWDLIKEHRLYTVKCYLSLSFLYYLSAWILHQILLKKDDHESRPFYTLTFHMLASLPNSVFVPAFGILKTVIYIHLMVVKENLTEDGLSIQVDQGMTSTTVPLLSDEQNEEDPEVIFYEEQHHTIFDPVSGEIPSTPERSTVQTAEGASLLFQTPNSSASFSSS
ncbi:unnamed protein product [Cylindrotheca closterium]|uniref:Uncharacterized protein n=1 Tax=Cylindrotheca closterium TaxID=2856 RepID=A0AAD2PVU8_9STRA|nr:unnamed protein product [Cylindrotheca closterium]